MHFEESIEIEAQQQRVWDVLSDLEAWPQRIETVDSVELLTPAPLAVGTRIRLKQPKLGEGIWVLTVWNAPSHFEWRQESTGITSVAGHRVEVLEEGRSRLTLSLDMHGPLIPVALFFRGLTNRYMAMEAQGIKRAAESAER
jgi:Polyketide cyclase / dehydrase and lipid transport